MVYPNAAQSVDTPIADNIVQASINISWAFSANDFGLKLYDPNNTMIAESNYLNLPGLTGQREEVVLRNPASQTLRSVIQHTAGVGTPQTVNGAVEVTRVQYPTLSDVTSSDLAEVQKCLLANILFPAGSKFRPGSSVSRADLATVLVRGGYAPQYMGISPMFTDTRDLVTRDAVESVQSRPEGGLFYDAQPGGLFYPNNTALRVVAAVAFVKAANLENLAATTPLPPTLLDTGSIPAQWRGYVAVALQRGFLSVSANRFEPNRAITRLEAARAINAMMR